MVEEEEIMGKSDPLLLLDNGTLAYILGNGEYRFTNLKFDEAKAIIEMKGEAEEDVVQVFRNPELERVMYSYLGLSCREFPYEPEERLNIGECNWLNFILLRQEPNRSCLEMTVRRQ